MRLDERMIRDEYALKRPRTADAATLNWGWTVRKRHAEERSKHISLVTERENKDSKMGMG